MSAPSSTLDRLRIERAVWTVDLRVQDLPRSSRIARRRELRDNLQEAASEVGAREAVSRLGDLHVLATDYLEAEYGDLRRRPSWAAAAWWIVLTEAVMLLVTSTGFSAFRDGVTAADQHFTGVVHWHGVTWLISAATFTFTNGHATSTGGAWTPLVYVVMLGGALVVGRIWRLVPALRRGRAGSR